MKRHPFSSAVHLVDYALAAGHTVSVWDEEEWAIKRSTDRAAILAAVDSVSCPELTIRDRATLPGPICRVGWALIVNGCEPDEEVADYSMTPFMEAWNAAYTAAVEGC